MSSRIAAVPSNLTRSAISGRTRWASSLSTCHSGRASPIRGPGISGLKITRRSVEVSVTPPGISYRVVAGRRITLSAGSSSIWVDITMSIWTRSGILSSACCAYAVSGRTSAI